MESVLPEKDTYAVGIVGVTGVVGQNIARDLRERDFPVDYVNSKLFSSPRSAGRTVTWGGHVHIVQYAETAEDYAGLDIVFLSAGGDATKSKVSKEECPKVAEAGAIAIDNSSAWRQDPEVPLVVTEANPEALEHIPKGIIANPNCTTMEAVTAVQSLDRAAGLVALNVTSMQSVSGQGDAGMQELIDQIPIMLKSPRDFLKGIIRNYLPKPKVFPTVVAGNVAPQAGTFVGRDTTEELKFINESRKIFGRPDLAVQATCFRVPVLNGHTLSISAEFEDELTPEQAEAILADAPGVELCDVPQPILATGRDEVLVGRIRADESRIGRSALQTVVAGDNVRKGASLNAVQIAELLVAKAA